MGRNASLDLRAIVAVFLLTLLWGFNYTAIKYSSRGISPIFTSTLCSMIALICGVIYCVKTGERLFHTDIMLFHGFMVGLLFGLEIACIYLGMLYTDVVRAVLFVYLSPFVVAVGAHFFLKGERLNFFKILGLILAFAGVFLVFQDRPKTVTTNIVAGDTLEIMAAFFWGATTLYIKKFMPERIQPIHTFLYQLFFSIPILLIMSLVLEPKWIYRIDCQIFASVLYQSVIVTFASYLIWFKLVHQHSVSKLSAFTFFTPVFGVLFGILFLKEEFTLPLIAGLFMVSIGIFLVNWRKGIISKC